MDAKFEAQRERRSDLLAKDLQLLICKGRSVDVGRLLWVSAHLLLHLARVEGAILAWKMADLTLMTPCAINGTNILCLDPSGGRVGVVLPEPPPHSPSVWKSTSPHMLCV